MNEILDILSRKELSLCELTWSIQGDIDQKLRKVEALGIFEQYKEIHKSYAEVVTRGSDDQKFEALKRAVFLNWYMVTEPSWLSGIGSLDEEAILSVYGFLNDCIVQSRLDAELNWMLSYYSSFDWAILHFCVMRFPAVSNFVKAVDKSIAHAPVKTLSEDCMENRGQMGMYWKSIFPAPEA